MSTNAAHTAILELLAAEAIEVEYHRSLVLECLSTYHDDRVPPALVARYRALSAELADLTGDEGFRTAPMPTPSELRAAWGWIGALPD